jgi:hypothetical protein
MKRMSRLLSLLSVLALLLMTAGCRAGGMPDIKQPGVFIESGGSIGYRVNDIFVVGSLASPLRSRSLPVLDL